MLFTLFFNDLDVGILTIHFIHQHMAAFYSFVNLMNEARHVYYNQFIEDNSTDQRRLFMASKILLNMQPDRSLPPHIELFHCMQMTWASSLLPRLLISDQSWTVSLHRIFRRRRSLIWYLNLAILYCLIFNVKRLKQYVI